MAERGHTVVTLGEAMLRMTPADGLRLERTNRLEAHVAGAEANVAAGLAHLGVDVAWLSQVPDTPVGRRVINDLAAAGVDVTRVRRVADGRLGIFYAEAATPPRPARVWYDRRGSSFSEMRGLEPDDAALEGARWAVVSGITPALGTAAQALTMSLAAAAAKHGAALCVDVNYRALLWPAEQARRTLLPLLQMADLVVCARRDAERLFGQHGSDAEVARGLAGALGAGGRRVVLTVGARGSVAVDRDGTIVEQAAFPAEVVDRFGVGDAFVAGLLSGLLDGDGDGDEDLPTALERAAAVAALKCTLAGDQAHVRLDDVQLLLAGGAPGVVR
jgi:2-dehydro-3-deoxygluconokinase